MARLVPTSLLLAVLAVAFNLPGVGQAAARHGHTGRFGPKPSSRHANTHRRHRRHRRAHRHHGTPATVAPGQVVSPFPAGMRLFSPTSIWNAALPALAPLDYRSTRLSGALSAEVNREVSANTGPWINTDSWSVPVYTVGAAVPKVRVALDVGVTALQRDFEAVPMPPNARVAGGRDGTLTVYQPSTDSLWEFWLAHRDADGWHARWGGKLDHVSTNPGFFGGAFGGSGTGLSLLGGLITVNEMRAGRIDHALALGIPNTAAGTFTWPAQRGDGRTVGPAGVPEGTHLRIDPSVNLTTLGLSRLGLAIARAAQRYGVVVRDTSGCVVFYAEDPITTGSNPYPQIFGDYPNRLLRGFPWGRMQVVAPTA